MSDGAMLTYTLPTGAAEHLHALGFYADLGAAAAVCVSLFALFWLTGRCKRQASDAGSHTLRQNEKASASLEFLLVFFPLLVLVLAVWQLAFMLNAQMHVGYAAYAAARSASTVVFLDLPDEPEGVLLNNAEPNAAKWQRIHRATIPATLPISPGNASSAASAYLSSTLYQSLEDRSAPDFDLVDLGALPGQLSVMTAHRGTAITEGNRISRAAVKALYAQAATRVLINGRDADGNQSDGNQAGNTYNLAGVEFLRVTVEYDFWLNVPYAGRMMRIAFGESGLLDNISHPTLTLRETVAINAWPQVTAY